MALIDLIAAEDELRIATTFDSREATASFNEVFRSRSGPREVLAEVLHRTAHRGDQSVSLVSLIAFNSFMC